jgi:signal transduction histidine kinase
LGGIGLLAIALLLNRHADHQLQELADAEIAYRNNIEATTSIRRAARMAYVAALEAGLQPRRDQAGGVEGEALAALPTQAVRFASCPNCDEAETRGRAAFVREIAAWASDAASQRGAAKVASLRAHLDEIDRIASASLEQNSSAAKALDATNKRLRDRQGRTRLVVLGLLMALIAGTVVWRIRTTLGRRLAAAKGAQREDHERNDALEERVAERTLELRGLNGQLRESLAKLGQTQAQLVEAQKLEGLGLMAAGIAHEINNPMSFVTANVASLQAALKKLPDPPPSLVEYRDEVLPETLDGIRRVNSIVADVRRFAVADSGRDVAYDLNEEVRAALRLARGKLGSRHELDLALGEIPMLRGRSQQLGQVILNLIVNALQATPNGGRIGVTTSRRGDEVLLTVSDDGPGIAESVRGKLFQPFVTTKPVGTGTGLGLSVSYGIAKAHGGTISVESSAGLGARFTVKLPVEPGRPAEKEATELSEIKLPAATAAPPPRP